jgi:magnesium-transporting ATPase (P-type)
VCVLIALRGAFPYHTVRCSLLALPQVRLDLASTSEEPLVTREERFPTPFKFVVVTPAAFISCRMPATPATPATPVPVFLWHAHTIDECKAAAESPDTERGLTTAEAEKRLAENGPNKLAPPERPSFLRKLWAQINSALIWVLLAAVVVSGAQGEWAEFGLILGVVIINVVIGMVQEGKAEKAADALSNMLAPRCTAVRNGTRVAMDASELVIGDVVFIQSGDRVPADLRIVSCTDLQIFESMLTGESLAVTKKLEPVAEGAGIGDRKCMAFSATLVQQGQGLGLVVATGDGTAIGSINALVQGEKEKPTSLEVQLELFGRAITAATIAIGIAAFFIAFFYAKSTWPEAFRASVAIAVAIIPEGLPAVVTITMALGVSVMAKHNAIVRKLPAVETLGSVSTVCSDKTGTLTKNEMTAVGVVTGAPSDGGFDYTVAGVGYDPAAGSVLGASGVALEPAAAERLRAIVLSAVIPNDGGLSKKAEGKWEVRMNELAVQTAILVNNAALPLLCLCHFRSPVTRRMSRRSFSSRNSAATTTLPRQLPRS